MSRWISLGCNVVPMHGSSGASLSEITGPGPNRLMSVMYDKATVLKEELTEVVGKDRFHVNNLLDKKHAPRHVCAIMRDAHRLLGLELPYCVLRGNCEHFVTELRYGRAESQQIHYAVKVGVRALAVSMKILTEAWRHRGKKGQRMLH
ncbi:phospholipase A and acyltransferase 3-like isoform X2 [Alosa alosa]|uniref:phospholipase A and acyltransferase 3-like isoform X2 n=1 Tax=Alosa alosa TaxID=278164 RepID=UPI0020153012|nr:phospholipase A and acyltransferase 3-like isoform X2 [Alosa alosa]